MYLSQELHYIAVLYPDLLFNSPHYTTEVYIMFAITAANNERAEYY